jgi:hypothetical protein
MRFAANAPRVAAAAVMLHPGIRTVAQIAGWLGLASLVYDEASGLWQSTAPDDAFQELTSDGYEWRVGSAVPWTFYPTLKQACDALYLGRTGPDYVVVSTTVTSSGSTGTCAANARYSNPDRIIYSRFTSPATRGSVSSCPSGWYVTDAGCVQTPPPKTVTQEEAIEELTKHPMPADVPRHIPTPLPVELPEYQPMFIPTGDPVTNPNFNPSQEPSTSNPPKIQPGVEVKPAPTPSSPWQVDTNPVNRPVVDPNAPPSREPEVVPDTGGPSGNEPKDPDKTDFCEKYPTVIACQELKHEDDDTKLPEKAIDLDFNPIPGFQGVKSCPAFPNLGNVLGGRQISWQPFCDQLAAISNLLLALAWLYAAWILYSSRGN